MIKQAADAPYTLRSIQEMLGLGRTAIASLIGAGFVTPVRGPRNEYRFSFQDVVLLRTAYHLRAAKIPVRKMLRSLKRLKLQLPDEVPLSGLRITAIGNDIAVREGNTHWEAESGQLLLDLDVAAAQGSISFMQRTPAAGSAPPNGASALFMQAERLEAKDPGAAESAYRAALAAAPDHVDAYVNLGAMLCEAARCAEAVELYDAALLRCPEVPLVHFNRAIALEDQQRDREALASYARCLELDPQFADAHYNAARIHDRLGQVQSALRHYSAFRRLQ